MAEQDSVADTVQRHWVTVEPHAETIERAPRATIRPSGTPGTSDRDAIARLTAIARGGEQAGDLEMGTTLGEGAMGVVRIATQTSLGREVAAKTLRPGQQEERSTLRLLREAWITGALEHPNIIPVHELRVGADGAPVVVLKKVEGEPWSALMHDPEVLRERFDASDPLAWNLRILGSVCNAVELAHSRGILHRDLKPDNVMVGAFGEVYVVDWGIAVTLRDDGDGRFPRASEATALAGTPSYMAPEMVGGSPPRLSERTDVYLLGAILYEILAGRPPHRGDNVMQLVGNLLMHDPELPEDAPDELAAICRRAIAREPEERFASVAELHRALDAFLEHRTSIRLADEAAGRLEELLALLEGGEQGSRDELHRAFGACRFGFLSALEAWPDNEAAREGLDRALEAMIEDHLAREDPSAAQMLLAEHSAPPEPLRERVEQALEAHRARQALLERLEEEQRQMDPRIGRGTRIAFAVTLGFLWGIAPIVGGIRTQVLELAQHPRELLLWPSFGLVLAVGLGLGLRRALLRTRLNRRLMALLTFAMGLTLIFHAGALRLGLAIATIQVLDVALFFAVATGLVVFVERRLWPTAAAFLLAFGVSSYDPTLRWSALAVSNWLMFANFLWVWPPWHPLRRDSEA